MLRAARATRLGLSPSIRVTDDDIQAATDAATTAYRNSIVQRAAVVPSKGSRVTSENGLVHGKWVRQLDVGALKPRKEKYFGPGNRSVQG